MSAIQRFFASIFTRRMAEDMEAESRTWMVRCPCGYERSVWDMGGVRWKAAGRPRKLVHCPQCGRTTWHTVYRMTEETPDGASS